MYLQNLHNMHSEPQHAWKRSHNKLRRFTFEEVAQPSRMNLLYSLVGCMSVQLRADAVLCMAVGTNTKAPN